MGELTEQHDICADCPGSLWGKHSICRIHGRSIGDVEHCHEWDIHEKRSQRRDVLLVSRALQQMEADIRGYAWNRDQIVELEQQIRRMDAACSPQGTNMVARYGVEATLAKSTAPEEDDEARYLRLRGRLADLRSRVARVDQAAKVITDPRERQVLDGMLASLPVKEIALRAGISRRTVERYRPEIIRAMAFTK